MWCVPKLNEEYKKRMEDVLRCYEKPMDPWEPLIAVDEVSKQLLSDKRPGLPASPGNVRREDYEYVRHGTRNLFVMVNPKQGRRKVRVTGRRTKMDFAHFMKEIAEKDYPKARRIHVIFDNLNTHNESSMVEAFGKRNGKRLWARFQPHYTPKHASWLNIAENEISVLSKQCLNRRIPGEAILREETDRWCEERNRKRVLVNWTFTRKKAQEKFPTLYAENF